MNESRLRQIIQEELMQYYLDEGAVQRFLSKINVKQMIKKTAANLKYAIGRAKVENIIAARIILNTLKEQKITPEEAKYLKEKSIDFAKVLNILGFQFLPGGNILLQIVNKILKKYGINILPQGREVPDQYKDYKQQKLRKPTEPQKPAEPQKVA